MSNSETGKTINGNNLLQSDPQRVSNKRHILILAEVCVPSMHLKSHILIKSGSQTSRLQHHGIEFQGSHFESIGLKDGVASRGMAPLLF